MTNSFSRCENQERENRSQLSVDENKGEEEKSSSLLHSVSIKVSPSSSLNPIPNNQTPITEEYALSPINSSKISFPDLDLRRADYSLHPKWDLHQWRTRHPKLCLNGCIQVHLDVGTSSTSFDKCFLFDQSLWISFFLSAQNSDNKIEEYVRDRFLVRKGLRRSRLGLELHQISRKPRNCTLSMKGLISLKGEMMRDVEIRTLLSLAIEDFVDRNWLVEILGTWFRKNERISF